MFGYAKQFFRPVDCPLSGGLFQASDGRNSKSQIIPKIGRISENKPRRFVNSSVPLYRLKMRIG